MAKKTKTKAKKAKKKVVKKAKKKPAKKAQKGTKGGKIRKKDKILEEKLTNPHLTQEQIAKKLESTRNYVAKALTTDEAKKIFDESERRLTEKLVGIREKAMEVLEDVVKGHGFNVNPSTQEVEMFNYPPALRFAAAKFALEKFMEKTGEPVPLEIEFETIITEMGIEQRQTKIFDRKEEEDDDSSV